MHTAIYEELKRVAKAGGRPIHYSDIALLADLDMQRQEDRNRMSEILDEISRHEHAQGRPLLSAVVVLMGEERPGKGFFQLAKSLGLKGTLDNDEFFSRELGRVFEAWKTTKS